MRSTFAVSALFLIPLALIGFQGAVSQDGIMLHDGEREVLILATTGVDSTATFRISALGTVRMFTSRGWSARAGAYATTPARLFLPPGAEAVVEAVADGPGIALSFASVSGDTVTITGRRLRVRQDSVSSVLMLLEAPADSLTTP